jgi:hypothetical protein
MASFVHLAKMPQQHLADSVQDWEHVIGVPQRMLGSPTLVFEHLRLDLAAS